MFAFPLFVKLNDVHFFKEQSHERCPVLSQVVFRELSARPESFSLLSRNQNAILLLKRRTSERSQWLRSYPSHHCCLIPLLLFYSRVSGFALLACAMLIALLILLHNASCLCFNHCDNVDLFS